MCLFSFNSFDPIISQLKKINKKINKYKKDKPELYDKIKALENDIINHSLSKLQDIEAIITHSNPIYITLDNNNK